MTQEQINKLQELKKLLDAGILTQEEMQTEKAKILGISQEQPVEATPATGNAPVEALANEIAEETKPLTTESKGPIVFDEPKETQQPTSSRNDKGNGVSTKTALIVLGVLAALIIAVLLFRNSDNGATHYSEPEESVESGSAYNDGSEESYEVEEATNTEDDSEDDEFAFDPWVGSIKVDGGMYRTCDSRCYLNFKKVSKGEYTGEIVIMLGSAWPDHDERYDPSHGYLEGTVRAKSDGNVLTVVMDRYTSRVFDPNNGDTNYFENENISGQIFRITYNGGSYKAVSVGDMEGYFDDSCKIKITK